MSFELAHPDGMAVPRTVEKTLATGQAFEDGALLTVNEDDEYEECGADPALIAAVAVSGAGSDTSGFNRFAAKEFPPGKMQGITVRGTQWTAQYIGTLPAVDNGEYGVVKDSDNKWKVDFDETVNTRVKLVGRRTDAPESVGKVVVEVLPNYVQII